MALDTGSFDMRRRLPLPPDRLWTLLTNPRHRERWGAPSEGTVLVMERDDLRVGGVERHRCGPEEAPEFRVETRWYHLASPERAVFTETVEAGGESLFTSLVTYLVEPTGGGSDFQVTVAVSSFVGPEALADVRAGWEGGLTNLERHVADHLRETV